MRTEMGSDVFAGTIISPAGTLSPYTAEGAMPPSLLLCPLVIAACIKLSMT